MQKKSFIVQIAFLILSIASMIISKAGQHIASGVLLFVGAILLYGYYFWISHSLVDLRALLSLFWIGGEGLAALQLSHLQTDWTNTTWVCFTGFYFMFIIGYELAQFYLRRYRTKKKRVYNRAKISSCLMICIILIAVGSLVSFITEVVCLGYVPILSEETHAYSNFHMTGIHYFTVTCMMVHALTLIYIMNRKSKMDKADVAMLVICNCMALLVAVACISKFQLLLTVALPTIIYLSIKKDINYRRLFLWGGIGVVALAGLFAFMIIKRNYGEGYVPSSAFDGYENNIHLLGLRSDVSAIENCADLFLSCALFEGLPIAVLEAYFNGVPCVLSPIPQHVQIASVSQVWIPEDFSAKAFLSTIYEALGSNKSHAAIYEERKSQINKYSINNTGRQYLVFYNEIINSNSIRK